MTTSELDRRDGMLDGITLAEILAKYKRVVIAGGPKTGKTTLTAGVTDREVFHTDDFNKAPWTEIPRLVIDQVKDVPAYVLEGVQAGRALWKGLEPDVVVYLVDPRAPRTKGQQALGKGCATVFRDWLSSRPEIPVQYGLED